MDTVAENTRPIGILMAASAVASVALLLSHPDTHDADFGGVLLKEAASQILAGVVHGGLIVVLTIQIACYAVLSVRLGAGRALVIAGLTFFVAGAAMQIVSLTVDGLIIPRIASRYLAAPADRLPYARSLFVFCNIVVQLVMPIGLVFQGLGISNFGIVLLHSNHWTGGLGTIIGALVVIISVVAFITGMEHLMFVAIALLALWALVAGVYLVRGQK